MRFTLFVLLLASLVVTATGARAEFHVATTGSDSNSGSASKPFATLERARDALRQLRSSGSVLEGEVTSIDLGEHLIRTAPPLRALWVP